MSDDCHFELLWLLFVEEATNSTKHSCQGLAAINRGARHHERNYGPAEEVSSGSVDQPSGALCQPLYRPGAAPQCRRAPCMTTMRRLATSTVITMVRAPTCSMWHTQHAVNTRSIGNSELLLCWQVAGDKVLRVHDRIGGNLPIAVQGNGQRLQ